MAGDRTYTLYKYKDGDKSGKIEVTTKKFKAHKAANDWFQSYRKEHTLETGWKYLFEQTG